MDLRKINAESQQLSSNPFAQFFKKDDGGGAGARPEGQPPKGSKKGPKAGPAKGADQKPDPNLDAGANPPAAETPGEE